MLSLDVGTVVLVPFPFTNQTAKKVRPAIVVSTSAFHRQRLDVVLIAVTSQAAQPLRHGEADIQDWQAAKLLGPSRIKPIIFSVEKQMVHKAIGVLSIADQRALRQTLEVILGFPSA